MVQPHDGACSDLYRFGVDARLLESGDVLASRDFNGRFNVIVLTVDSDGERFTFACDDDYEIGSMPFDHFDTYYSAQTRFVAVAGDDPCACVCE